MQVKRKARWLLTISAAAVLVAGILSMGFASEPKDLRRLVVENQVAGLIAQLNLTAGQKAELKALIDRYRETANGRRAELARLLEQRRDALLSGDREAVEELDRKLRELVTQNPWAKDEEAKKFVAGLTERQKEILERILPGISRTEIRSSRPRLERPMPGPLPGLRDRFEWRDRFVCREIIRRPGDGIIRREGDEIIRRGGEAVRCWSYVPGMRRPVAGAARTEYLDILSEFLGR